MASSWALSTYPQDVAFTFNWTIDDFNKGMERTNWTINECDDGVRRRRGRGRDGRIDSPCFKMPGLPWSFFFRIADTTFEYERPPRELKIEEVLTPVTNYFGVQLCVETPNRKEADLRELRLAGSLDLSETDQEGVERNKLAGQIYNWSDHPHTAEQKTTGMIKHHNTGWKHKDTTMTGWHFGTEKENFEIDLFNPDVDLYCSGINYIATYYNFYTLGDAPGLSLKAVIKIPTKMVSSSGSVKRGDSAGKLPFKSLLSKPDFSDVRLKCGQRMFSSHRVLLANK